MAAGENRTPNEGRNASPRGGDLRIRTTRVRTGAHVITVTGDLDRRSADALRDELERVPASRDVVVDLEAVAVVDSIALSALLGSARRRRRAGGCLIIVCGQEHLRSLFRRTGIEAEVGIVEAHDEALRYLLGRVLLRRLSGRGSEGPATAR